MFQKIKKQDGWYLIIECEKGVNFAHLKIALNSYSGGDFDVRLDDTGIWVKPYEEQWHDSSSRVLNRQLIKLRYFADGFFFGANSQAKKKYGMPWNI